MQDTWFEICGKVNCIRLLVASMSEIQAVFRTIWQSRRLLDSETSKRTVSWFKDTKELRYSREQGLLEMIGHGSKTQKNQGTRGSKQGLVEMMVLGA